MSLSREDRWEKYGYPTRLPDDLDGLILVFGHTSREAAESSAKANRVEHGHPSHAENRDGQWVSVVDLRPRIAQIEQELRDEGFYDKSS